MFRRSVRISLGLALTTGLAIAAGVGLSRHFEGWQLPRLPSWSDPAEIAPAVAAVDEAFSRAWEKEGVTPTPPAEVRTMARRLSLALTGAPPSLEELRRLERLPADADPVQSWLDHLLTDRRYAAYFAERFARAFVGVEPGPFLVYRRRRLVNWLTDQLAANRPYDELVRELVAADGIWTTNPATNFVTNSIVQGGDDEGPDPVTLTTRTSRAFLGISLDCVQCHDDHFGDRWKQEDFHQLAAFYGQAEMSLTGVRDERSRDYEARYLGESEPETVPAAVPYRPELLPERGDRRNRLARWITHPDNDAFARAAVNRTWALLFGRPLAEPVDDIPLEGPHPPGLQELAEVFVESDHDLRVLIRVIAASAPFRLDSRSADPASPVTREQEEAWAAFPVTPLRPEQVAGGVIQAASLQTIDHGSHILHRLRRFGETQDFVTRYGDPGEEEFQEEAGTIPQRLLLMNGKLVHERTEPNAVMNAATRLAHYAPSDAKAIEAAFLATLTRQPTEEESAHFTGLLHGATGAERERIMQDVYWALVNTTEFSWNR